MCMPTLINKLCCSCTELTVTMVTYLVVSDVQSQEHCPSLEPDPIHCTTSHKHPTTKVTCDLPKYMQVNATSLQ